jgi:F-type H+-transporting ATPase subunit alpha
VRLALAQYRELAAFAQFASDLDEATRKQLERGRMVTELMKQAQYSPMPISEMAVTLYAVDQGFYDDVEVRRALEFEKSLMAYLKQNAAAVLSKIESTQNLDGETEKELVAAINAFKGAWV